MNCKPDVETVVSRRAARACGVFAAVCIAGGAAFADSAKSISINFSGTRDANTSSTDAALSEISGAALCGALPVPGDNWNNFQTHWSGYGSSIERSEAIKLCDGTTAEGVSVEFDSAYIYTVTTASAPGNLFHSFLAYDSAKPQNLYLEISGLTAENGFPETCTVYIYASTDRTASSIKFCPKTVNGTTYTFKDGAVTEGNNAWGGGSYARNGKLVEGGDYLKIENVPITDGKVRISHAAASEGTGNTYHGSIAAVQLDFGGTSDYALSVNFSGGQSKNDSDYGALSGTELYGALPVAGDDWNNICLQSAENIGGLLWNDGQPCAGNVALSFSCKNTWAIDANNTPGHLFHSYLDDGNSNNHAVTFTGLTAENGFPGRCWLYVYESTDTKLPFEPVSVNGVNYAYASGVVCESTAKWGAATTAKSNTLELGGDYLKIGPVAIPENGTLMVTTPNSNGTNARGGIAAVQVVFSTPTEFTVAATCEEGQGTVQAGEAAAGATSAVAGVFGTPVVATLAATPAAGYIFDHWEGPMGLVTSGAATDTSISVKTEMPATFTAVFVPDNMPWTATWTGGGAAGDLSDPANWSCANRGGLPVEGAIPAEDTTVILSGSAVFACPQGSTLVCKAYDFRNVQLAGDVDWSGLDLSKPAAAGSTVDLAGHTLALSGSGDTAAESFAVTDASAQGGTLLVSVAEDAELDNKGIAISGTVRLVKDGAGTLGAYKSGQTYTGGTHVKNGVLRMHTSSQPLGPCDKTQTVRIDEGATLDINKCRTNCFYNYELGGTLVVEGAAQSDAWADAGLFWMARIELVGDAHIKGGFFYFGSADADNRCILSLGGHTLYMDLTKGEIYANHLETDSTGGKIVFTAGGMQQGVVDFSSVDVHFQGSTYDFFAGGTAVDFPVKGFSYERNYWKTHDKALKVTVAGVYTAGAYRPPMTLKDGATLDLSGTNGCWSAKGQAAATGKTNRSFSTPGLVSFESGATVTVDLGEREFEIGETKIVDWNSEPSASFALGTARYKGLSLVPKADGLYANRRPFGFMIMIR